MVNYVGYFYVIYCDALYSSSRAAVKPIMSGDPFLYLVRGFPADVDGFFDAPLYPVKQCI